MDRFDDLLIKARAEMLGKSQPRQVITKDTAFSMAWDLTKGFEDQMRAMQARQQRPGFVQRMKDSFGANRKTPQQSVSETLQGMGGQGLGQSNIPLPTQQGGQGEQIYDPFGQRTGNVNVPATASRVSGLSPTMADLGPGGFGQGGGADKPLEPSKVPRRANPVQTERAARSLPPTMQQPEGVSPSEPEGVSPSELAQNMGAPSDQALLNAFNALEPHRKRENYEHVTRRNVREKQPTDRAINEFFTPGEAGSAHTPTQAPNKETLELASKFFDPSVPKNVHGRPIPKRKPQGMIGTGTKRTTSKKTPTTPNETRNLPVLIPKPSNTALSTRGEKIESLDKIPMIDGSVKQLGSGTITNPLQLGQGRSPPQLTEGGEQRTSQAKAGRKLERPSPNIIDGFKPPEPKQKKTPKKEPKPQVEGQTESVNQPKPQVEEQSKPVPPTTKQNTLFGGDEKSAPVKNNNATATTKEAKKRSEQRNKIRGNTEATTKVGGEKGGSNEQEKPLPRISSMTDSSVLNELMDRAEEGDEAARKHLYNSMGDLQDHHPSVAERYENAFGKMIQDANLSLLPSGMRNSLLKDNNADVNYSLLPNGWV